MKSNKITLYYGIANYTVHSQTGSEVTMCDTDVKNVI